MYLNWDILTLTWQRSGFTQGWRTHQPSVLFPVPQICLHQRCKEGQAEIQSCEGPIFWAGGSWKNRRSKCSFSSLYSVQGQNRPGQQHLTLEPLLICCSAECTAFRRNWTRRTSGCWVGGKWRVCGIQRNPGRHGEKEYVSVHSGSSWCSEKFLSLA